MERRLAAVLAADMVGYSRLIGIDEKGTLAAFRRHRAQLFGPVAGRYRGRIIKFIGDGALLEFASAVDSICFAVEVQIRLRDENTGLDENRQLRYRIGVSIGDILTEDGDIYGDGVIVATRLEQQAEPGGICLSAAAFDQVKGKVDLSFECLGTRQVKNISESITIYRVVLDPKAEALATSTQSGPPASKPRRLALVGATVLLLLVLIGAALWWVPGFLVESSESPGDVERFAYPLPDKPSIAVLPFINVSGEAAHNSFAEGLTDDLITELSKVSGLFVIARHSVFAIRSPTAKIQDVAAELGVHYVLEGTLQQADSRLRINVKLIDALSGLALWAERYDRQHKDLFAVQDEVIAKIMSALSVSLSEGERDRLTRIPTNNLEAYDSYLRAEQEGFLYSDVETYRRALSYYQRAIDLDPGFAEAHAGIARIAVEVWRNDYNILWPAAVSRKIAYDAAGQALKLDASNARAHTVLALLQLVAGHRAEAVESAGRAIAAQPNDPEAHGNMALVLVHAGNRKQAVTELETAMRLDPAPPPSFELLAGVVLYMAENYERAIRHLEAARDALPDVEPAREHLAAAYAEQGDQAKAAEETLSLLRIFPESNLTYYAHLYDFWLEEDRNRHLLALRKAGLTEWPFGFNGREPDRLETAQLEGLIQQKTWTGEHKNGTGFIQYFDIAGNTAYRSENTTMTGTVRVEGDRLCERFAGYFQDRTTCGYVYRNSGRAGSDYTHVTPGSLKFFSVNQQQ